MIALRYLNRYSAKKRMSLGSVNIYYGLYCDILCSMVYFKISFYFLLLGMCMMRKFRQNKLWRDKAVDIMEQEHGSCIHWRRLDDQEFDEQIRIKLLEEAQEVVAAENRQELLGELADVQEVLSALAGLHGITQQEIDAIQIKKQHDRGGFGGRRFVDIAEHPVGGFGEKYCLADPVKYPEVIER
jgi:predicted house-cleaning noncanonical NTP pyrophosphatase (MazG superfamily)